VSAEGGGGISKAGFGSFSIPILRKTQGIGDWGRSLTMFTHDVDGYGVVCSGQDGNCIK